MRTQDIKIGEYYRLYNSPNYSYVKPIQIIKAGTFLPDGTKKTYAVVKCEHLIHKNDTIGFIRYFRACDLIKIKE